MTVVRAVSSSAPNTQAMARIARGVCVQWASRPSSSVTVPTDFLPMPRARPNRMKLSGTPMDGALAVDGPAVTLSERAGGIAALTPNTSAPMDDSNVATFGSFLASQQSKSLVHRPVGDCIG